MQVLFIRYKRLFVFFFCLFLSPPTRFLGEFSMFAKSISELYILL